MRLSETVRTRFQTLEIWKSAVAAEFRVAGAIHAAWHRERFLTGLAWDIISAGALLRPGGPPASVLMLGLAGGTSLRTLRHLLPYCRFTAVDIDPGIIELARGHMELDELGAEIHIADAYEWLAANRRTFDVVFDDIYLAGRDDVFRPQPWTPEILATLRNAVAPGGVLAANLVTGPGHRAVQSRTRRMLREAFPVVRSLVTPEGMNEVLVAGGEVAGRAALERYLEKFPDPDDRRYWKRIQIRGI